VPTYEFRCPDGTIVERVFKMSEVPESIPSPKGDGVAVRIISGGADLIFKGSGFYITDYGKDGKKDQRESASKESKPAAKSGSGESGGDSSGGTGKTESAPKSDSPPPGKPPGKPPKSGPAPPASGAAA